MKSKFLLLLTVLALTSCATSPRTRNLISVSTPENPKLSIVHLSGKITRIPTNSKWPASIKVGTSFDYWAVIDNRAPDSNISPNRGSYLQDKAPTRYELQIGESFKFSSERLMPRKFSVSVRDNLYRNDDGFFISPMYHTTLQEMPEVHAIAFHISMATRNPDLIQTDNLPFRPLAIKEINGGIVSNFRGIAFLKADNSPHSIEGKVDKFEVFQASADTPIGTPAP